MADYFDYALSLVNPAVASAVARAAKACREDGTALRVEANWRNKPRFYWVGCPYDVQNLARELRLNRAENVVVEPFAR
jgi:hypothetical protein